MKDTKPSSLDLLLMLPTEHARFVLGKEPSLNDLFVKRMQANMARISESEQAKINLLLPTSS